MDESLDNNQSNSGNDDPSNRVNLGAEVSEVEAQPFANRIRERITADPDVVIGEHPKADLLSIVGTAHYGWWDGDDYHEVVCTSRDSTTILSIKSTFQKGEVPSITEREYELGDGKRPYYDEFKSTVHPSGSRAHEYTDLVPGSLDMHGVLDENSDIHTLRQGHVAFADAMLANCVKANLISLE